MQINYLWKFLCRYPKPLWTVIHIRYAHPMQGTDFLCLFFSPACERVHEPRPVFMRVSGIGLDLPSRPSKDGLSTRGRLARLPAAGFIKAIQ